MTLSILEAVHDAAIAYLRERSLSLASEIPEISTKTDAFNSGLLDSLAFVELISFVEREAKVNIDFLMVDPEKLETVGDLINELSGAATFNKT